MNQNVTSLLPEHHQADRTRTEAYDRGVHNEIHTRGDRAATRWASLAHAALNQAKMAAPRTASTSPITSIPRCA